MSGPRNSGGEILALAKTDTGVTSVFWEPLSKTWVLSDNSVGDVLAAAPAPASLLLEEEVDTSNLNSEYISYINNLKNESNVSYHKIPKKFDWDDILNFFKSIFIRKNK